MRINGAESLGSIQSGTLPPPRLVEAAHEFEAQMMKELLIPMTRGSSMDGDETDSKSIGTLADFATEALGQALSESGGLGIATSILRRLSPYETSSRLPPNVEALRGELHEKTSRNSCGLSECR